MQATPVVRFPSSGASGARSEWRQTVSKQRVVLAVAIGALLAIAVAVPVVAGVLGKPAETGYVRLYHYTAVETDTAPVPQYVATGTSKVRLVYDTKVDPWSLCWTLAATGLQPRVEYSLVNIERLYWGDPVFGDFWVVDVLGRKTAGSRGTLTMKGATCALASTLSPYQDPGSTDEGYYGSDLETAYGFDTRWFRFPGAEVWLVPSSEVGLDDGSGMGWDEPFNYVRCYDENGSAVNPDWWMASLGLPVDNVDIDARIYDYTHDEAAPAPPLGAPASAEPTAARR